MQPTTGYPLQWPAHWPRTQVRESSNFRSSLTQALRDIHRQLDLMGATNVIISTNIPLTRYGTPYANFRMPDDSGVAVYYELDGVQQCIPCDRWINVWENCRAIAKTIEAQRGIGRWGTKAIVEATFTGYKQLPAAVITPAPSRKWYDILGVAYDADIATIKAAYRNLANVHHPDAGGDNDYFVELTKAYNEGMTNAKNNI